MIVGGVSKLRFNALERFRCRRIGEWLSFQRRRSQGEAVGHCGLQQHRALAPINRERRIGPIRQLGIDAAGGRIVRIDFQHLSCAQKGPGEVAFRHELPGLPGIALLNIMAVMRLPIVVPGRERKDQNRQGSQVLLSRQEPLDPGRGKSLRHLESQETQQDRNLVQNPAEFTAHPGPAKPPPPAAVGLHRAADWSTMIMLIIER